ncbi:MAG TPA: hypothetical protein VGQ42_16585 [Candidatus Dormibacteraeota bacterium]|jgi:hypothetical protein|nr:hypothetical protein [Candidatus Dormibacteraeota bacterium]
MRRFGWVQVAGFFVACAVVAVLAVLAFGRGAAPPRPVSPRASSSARATATPDARVAEVEAAARRYVQALATAMKTGSPDELDALSVPGSQAEGNAGVSAGLVQNSHKAFVTNRVTFGKSNTNVNSSSATVDMEYSLAGYDADWPSMEVRSTERTITGRAVLEMTLTRGRWLVDAVH